MTESFAGLVVLFGGDYFTIVRDRDGVFQWAFERRIDNWVLLIIAQYTNTAAVALLNCSQCDFVTPLPILGYSIHVILFKVV